PSCTLSVMPAEPLLHAGAIWKKDDRDQLVLWQGVVSRQLGIDALRHVKHGRCFLSPLPGMQEVKVLAFCPLHVAETPVLHHLVTFAKHWLCQSLQIEQRRRPASNNKKKKDHEPEPRLFHPLTTSLLPSQRFIPASRKCSFPQFN